MLLQTKIPVSPASPLLQFCGSNRVCEFVRCLKPTQCYIYLDRQRYPLLLLVILNTALLHRWMSAGFLLQFCGSNGVFKEKSVFFLKRKIRRLGDSLTVDIFQRKIGTL